VHTSNLNQPAWNEATNGVRGNCFPATSAGRPCARGLDLADQHALRQHDLAGDLLEPDLALGPIPSAVSVTSVAM